MIVFVYTFKNVVTYNFISCVNIKIYSQFLSHVATVNRAGSISVFAEKWRKLSVSFQQVVLTSLITEVN